MQACQGFPLRRKVFRPSSRSQGTYHFSSRESPKFGLLSKVTRLVLIIPHSNAGEESVQFN